VQRCCNVAVAFTLNVTATLHPRGEAGNPGERRRDASVCHRGPASPALTLLGTPLRRAGQPPEDSRMYRPPAACIEPVTPEASCQASHREPGSRAVLSIQRARRVGTAAAQTMQKWSVWPAGTRARQPCRLPWPDTCYLCTSPVRPPPAWLAAGAARGGSPHCKLALGPALLLHVLRSRSRHLDCEVARLNAPTSSFGSPRRSSLFAHRDELYARAPTPGLALF
jgi:hypothetical protein